MAIPLCIRVLTKKKGSELNTDDLSAKLKKVLAELCSGIEKLPLELLINEAPENPRIEQLLLIDEDGAAEKTAAWEDEKVEALEGKGVENSDEPVLKPMEKINVIPVLTLSAGSVTWDFPPSWGGWDGGRTRLSGLLTDLLDLNLELQSLGSSEEAQNGMNRSRDWFFSNFGQYRDLPGLVTSKGPWLENLLALFSAADYLAILYQKKRNRSLKVITFSVIFISLFLNLSGFFGLASLGLGFLLMVAVFFYYRKVKMERWEWRYYSYRALAELLRVCIFWHLGGVGENPAASFLAKYDTDFGWLKSLLGFLYRDLRRNSHEPDPLFVGENWITAQRKYFGKSLKRFQGRGAGNSGIGKLILVAGLFNTAFLVTVSVLKYYIPGAAQVLGVLPETGRITMSLLIQGGTLLSAYHEMMGFKELASNYKLTYQLFVTAENAFADHSEPAMVIRALGQEAMKEHEAWLLLHQGKQIQNPLLKMKR